MLPLIQPDGPSSDPAPFERVGIVGVGLIGGSLGLALKRAWPAMLVVAVDRKDVIEPAMRMGAADVGGDDLGLIGGAELVVLAAPVRGNNAILPTLAGYVDGDALVTDVGSTKRSTVAAARALPPRLPFIGGHPLAGAAAGGLQAARPDLFAGRPWILTPNEATQADGLQKLSACVTALGAHVHHLDAATHDSLLGVLSHLPQLTVTALMGIVGERAQAPGLRLAGRGLRDTTRLASSPFDIWRDITATNADSIGNAIDALVAALLELKDDLEGRTGAMARTFAAAAEWKRVLEDD